MILNFFTKPLARLEVWALAAASFLLSLAVLHRWILTPLGLKSYGRVWQNYISYVDIGFTRRSLWGTVLSVTGLNNLYVNEYINSLIVHSLGLFVLVLCVAYFMAANARRLSTVHAFVVFLSPAFVLHLAYSTGTVDYVLAFLLFASCLYVRSSWLIGVVAAAGVLIHEAYLFFVPFLALNNFLLLYGGRSSGAGSVVKHVLPAFFSPILAILMLKVFGAQAPSRAYFESLMREKIPLAADQHGLWSGFFEIFSSVNENAQSIGKVVADFSGNILYAAIPLAYVLILCAFIFRSKSSIGSRLMPFYAASLLLPLAISLIATDYLRWICMTSQLCLLSLVTLQVSGILSVNAAKITCLLPFSFVAPFGGAELSHPFPMHQFALKKLL